VLFSPVVWLLVSCTLSASRCCAGAGLGASPESSCPSWSSPVYRKAAGGRRREGEGLAAGQRLPVAGMAWKMSLPEALAQ